MHWIDPNGGVRYLQSSGIEALGALSAAARVGLAARLYESSGVRNMLIRLGRAKKGSNAERNIKQALPVLIADLNSQLEQIPQLDSVVSQQ